MNTWQGPSLIGELLARGTDDWVHAAEIYDVTSRSGLTDPNDRRALALGLIAEVLLRGLMEAGDVADSGFAAWATSPSDSLERIAVNWLGRPDPAVMPGEIMWLNNTPSGQAIGEGVVTRERAGS